MNTTTFRPATDKQFAFIRKLIGERYISVETEAEVQAARNAVMRGSLSTADASALIDTLLDLPMKSPGYAPRPADSDPEPGIYKDGDKLVRVYKSQRSGRSLAKQVLFSAVGPTDDGDRNWFDPEGEIEADLTTSITYEYMGLAAKVLAPEARRLSVSEVGALGKSWDHCLMCGRRLDDPESVDRGIGPVCAARY